LALAPVVCPFFLPSPTFHAVCLFLSNSDCVPVPDYVAFLTGALCGGGQYVAMGTTTCATCTSGTYSLGGGVRVSTWCDAQGLMVLICSISPVPCRVFLLFSFPVD
jgi:hypothetical protein